MRRASVRKHQAEYDAAFAVQDHWKSIAGWIAVVVAAMLVVDAFLLPGLVRRGAPTRRPPATPRTR